MEWIKSFLSSIAMILAPVLGFIIFFRQRKDARFRQSAELNQQHRQAIDLVINFARNEFDSHCVQALTMLSEAANLAEGFDSQVWQDITDTGQMINELRQITAHLGNHGMNSQTRRRLAERQGQITSELMSKLHRL